METRDLVVGERGVGDLAAVDVHLLEHGEAEMHQRRAGNLRLDDLRIDRACRSRRTLIELGDLDVAGLGVDLDLGAGAGDHPERRDVRALPVPGAGGT